MSNSSNIPTTKTVKIFGIGGGACNIIRSFTAATNTDLELIAVSSDSNILDRFKTVTTLQIGDGTGAQADPNLGSNHAENSSDKLQAHLQGTHLVILIACMGGGNGTGSTPVIARLAKKIGAYVAVICTIPFNREGQRRLQKAADGIEQLKGQADLLVTIPNEFIFATAKPTVGILDAFTRMDELVQQVVQEIVQKHAVEELTEIQAIKNIEGAYCTRF